MPTTLQHGTQTKILGPTAYTPQKVCSQYIRGPIPTDVEDMCNGLPKGFQTHASIRDIFLANIRLNTMHDEPHAPQIRIVNPVNAEPCPPMEFYYTNVSTLNDKTVFFKHF